MRFRLAVRAIEAWLLADAERMAGFLGVAATSMPREPERLDDPKQTLVHLAGRSRRAAVKKDLVPRPGSGRAVGDAYAGRLADFALDELHGWRPAVAAERAPSLRACLAALSTLSSR
jgi:hypothetical protein